MITAIELSTRAKELTLPALDSIDDDALIVLQQTLAGIRRSVDGASADVAAEIARRSSRQLGYAGLAQRLGARTPERLVQRLTGTSIHEARTLVESGRMLATAEGHDTGAPANPVTAQSGSGETAADGGDPEAAPSVVLAGAIRSGVLSLEQSRAIEVGLGRPDETTPDAQLDTARNELITLASSISVEELRAHARVLRDELDSARVADREAARRDQRYLRLFPQEDGMTRLIGLLDPESAARVQTVVDAALSPRRGGPRFVDEDDKARADQILNDSRTNDQLALDTVVALIDAGAAIDVAGGGALLGRNGAPVHVLVTAKDLSSGSGFARITGQEAAISIASAERRACTDGVLSVLFDKSGRNVLRLGRTRRRFSANQRSALVARDGCCRRCGGPALHTEAHHIVPWSHGGLTDIDNAILLCRFDHLLIHNNRWRIEKDLRGEPWFVPPLDVDPLQRRIPAHPPNPALRRLAG